MADLVKSTVEHFGKHYPNITEEDAKDIINNFICFAHLLMKLDKKRTEILKNKGETTNG